MLNERSGDALHHEDTMSGKIEPFRSKENLNTGQLNQQSGADLHFQLNSEATPNGIHAFKQDGGAGMTTHTHSALARAKEKSTVKKIKQKDFEIYLSSVNAKMENTKMRMLQESNRALTSIASLNNTTMNVVPNYETADKMADTARSRSVLKNMHTLTPYVRELSRK